MNKNLQIGIFSFIFTLLFIGNTQSFAQNSLESEKNILVLHSYHQGLGWTDSITNGIRSVFKSRPDINLIFEYLDTKRNYNDEYFSALQNIYRVKAKQIPFQAIITSDNAAFDFIKKYGPEFYPNIPIIFCGVNNLDPNILKDYPNFFGYAEEADHFGTLSAIKSIFPEKKNIFIINDNTTTGQAIQKEVDLVSKQFKDLNFETLSEFTIESLQEKIKNLDQSYAIYLLVLNRDKNGNFISYQNGISHIKEVANVPIFGSWDFYLDRGLFGGKITRGYEQGVNAANLALKLSEEDNSRNIPQFNHVASSYVFDHRELLKYNISINQLPEDSLVINEPKTSNLILKISLISIIILVLIVVLLLIWLKIKQQRAKVLQNLIHTKTYELKETNLQLEQVIQNKNKFFSILAHDLRGSIGMILNLSTFINNDDFEISEKEKNEFNKDIFHVVTRTNGLLEDLFYWGINQAKDGPKLNYSTFNIYDVLTEMSKTFRVNLNEVQIKVQEVQEIEINCDLNIFKFIIRNLIQNGIKYSHKGECISLIAYKKDDQIYIEVKDQGIGMSQEIIDSIHQKDPIRIEGLSGQKTTGLGLPTVLDYLEILQAKLEITSQENKGSLFRVICPNPKA
jgi:signal transduction histidine kinase